MHKLPKNYTYVLGTPTQCNCIHSHWQAVYSMTTVKHRSTFSFRSFQNKKNGTSVVMQQPFRIYHYVIICVTKICCIVYCHGLNLEHELKSFSYYTADYFPCNIIKVIKCEMITEPYDLSKRF